MGEALRRQGFFFISQQGENPKVHYLNSAQTDIKPFADRDPGIFLEISAYDGSNRPL